MSGQGLGLRDCSTVEMYVVQETTMVEVQEDGFPPAPNQPWIPEFRVQVPHAKSLDICISFA